MGALKPWHIIVLVVVLLLLFGAKRLPDAARGLGRSLRIFKSETEGLMKDDVRGKAEAKSTRTTADDRVEIIEPVTEVRPPVTEVRETVTERRSDVRDER